MEFPEGVKVYSGSKFEIMKELDFAVGEGKSFVESSLDSIHSMIHHSSKNLDFGHDMLVCADAGFAIMNCNYENRRIMAYEFKELLETERAINQTEKKLIYMRRQYNE